MSILILKTLTYTSEGWTSCSVNSVSILCIPELRDVPEVWTEMSVPTSQRGRQAVTAPAAHSESLDAS